MTVEPIQTEPAAELIQIQHEKEIPGWHYMFIGCDTIEAAVAELLRVHKIVPTTIYWKQQPSGKISAFFPVDKAKINDSFTVESTEDQPQINTPGSRES